MGGGRRGVEQGGEGGGHGRRRSLLLLFLFFFALLMAPRVRSERRDLGFAREKRERDKMRTGHAYGCRPCAGEERGLGLAIWGEGESDFWD